MSRVKSGLGSLSPVAMLRIYAAVVVVVATVAIGSVIYTSARIEDRSGQAAEHANASVTAAQIQTELRAPISTLFITVYAFIANDGLDQLDPGVQEALLQQVVDRFETDGITSIPLPLVEVPIPDRNRAMVERDVALILGRLDELADYQGVDLSAVMSKRDQVEASLAAYFDTGLSPHFRDAFSGLVELGEALEVSTGEMSLNMAAAQQAIDSATNLARRVVLVAVAGLAVTLLAATYFVARTIQRAFATGENERVELRRATSSLKYRNEQLNALYNVFAELTDTLSMPYVISATLRETLRVMRASMVTVRLLKGNQLVMAGNLTVDGQEIEGFRPVALGEGPIGRVARRGRSMRIDSNALEMLGPQPAHGDPNALVQSGIIVPLIVGARVVGTLACWSNEPAAYAEEDERVLEMMASQVATAVLAVDTTEMFERRALQDPLTNLPNRRQLAQEVSGSLAQWVADGRRVAVGMIDIDHFKQLNDQFGHRVGDVTLQKVAGVLRQGLRDSDRIYRYGGEEFVIMLADADTETAISVCNRLIETVAETAHGSAGSEQVGSVTVSIGVALMPEHGTEFGTLIDLADRALYRAKQAGRNRLAVWDGDTSVPELSRIA